MNCFLKVCLLLSLSTAPFIVSAATYLLPPSDTHLIGALQTTLSRQEETLLDIARRFDIGQKEILLANPNVDRWIPGEQTKVIIPSRFILPDAPRKGLVLNVPEMRLYYFPQTDELNPSRVITHPVSIGRMDWTTPIGLTHIIQKTKDPVWRPPASIKKEHAANGETLPDIVPAGPDNPLGRYALRLDVPGYLIHGTNKPFGVGMRVTHGCVRMYPEDIEKLFPEVRIGTAVTITNQTIKLGWLAGRLYIEVHPPLEEEAIPDEHFLAKALDLIEKANYSRLPLLDGAALKKALSEKSGIPIAISR